MSPVIRHVVKAILPYSLVRFIQDRRRAAELLAGHPFLAVVARINARYGGNKIRHCAMGAIGAHVVFNCRRVDACCSPTHGRQPYLFDYAGGEFPVETFYKEVERLIGENQTGTGECIGCAHLKDMRVPARFMPEAPAFIGQGHANLCTARCVYCVQTHGDTPQFDSLYNMADTVRSMVFQRFFRPGETVFSWGGGEPTALHDFEETCLVLSLCDFRQNVNTNAIVFCPALAEALKRGRATVVVSVDSGTRDCYRRVKRVDRFDAVWTNILRYAATGSVLLKYIVFSENSATGEIDSFLRLCAEAGIRGLMVSTDLNSAQTRMFDVPYDAVVTGRELAAAGLLSRKGRLQGMTVSFDHTWTAEHLDRIRVLADE